MFADEGNFNLDRLLDLPVLDAFIKETLRLYAPLPASPRVYVSLAFVFTFTRPIISRFAEPGGTRRSPCSTPYWRQTA